MSKYDGVSLEGCSVSLGREPFFFGARPFRISCTVVRQGNRDITPPGVDKTPKELEDLAQMLAVAYPGAVVPPVDLQALKRGDVVSAKRFMARLLEHPELKTAEILMKFLFGEKISSNLAGDDVAYSAAARRFFGHLQKNNEIQSVIAWTTEKDRLLSLARHKASRALESTALATRDLANLFMSGGVLLAATEENSGISQFIARIDEEQRYISNLRLAAKLTSELEDRRDVAHQVLEGLMKSRDDSWMAATQLDIFRAEERLRAIEQDMVDAAFRFAREAKIFVQTFPERWTEIVNELVDAHIQKANALSRVLAQARKDKKGMLSSDEYQHEDDHDDDDDDLVAKILRSADTNTSQVLPPAAVVQAVKVSPSTPDWYHDDDS